MNKNSDNLRKRLILNASPTICLLNAELEIVIHELSHSVVMPGAVWNEIVQSPRPDRASRLLKDISWIECHDDVNVSDRLLAWDLGQGETEVLSLTLRDDTGLAVIDDAEARRCAKTLDIGYMGTGGLLLVAKKQGVITSVTECLDDLGAAGLWISEDIRELLVRKAGEL